MKYRRLIFFMLLTTLPAVAYATSIVAIWTEKQITIAADSKQTLRDQNGNIIGSQQGCKVFQVRGIIFALSGLAAREQISVTEEIKNGTELTESGTGKKLPVDSIVVAADGALVKMLKARSATSDMNMPIDLLIAGMIDGKLQMIRETSEGMRIQGPFATPKKSGRITYPDGRGHDHIDPNRGIEPLGLENAINKFKTVLPEWDKGGDVDVARRLVAIEASDTRDSQFVGPPISTIIIDKEGMQWIDRGKCDWDVPKAEKNVR